MIVIINVILVVAIVFVCWWFGFAKTKNPQRVQTGVIDIVVEHGVYKPAQLVVKAGEAIELRFLRKDQSPCSATVVFKDLHISAELPHNQPRSIQLPPLSAGEYAFTCQMGMYRGKLLVQA